MQENKSTPLPKLPVEPTAADRVQYVIALMAYENIAIRQVYVLNIIELMGYRGPLEKLADKLKMLTKAKSTLKNLHLAARIEDNHILEGYLIAVKHNNQCVGLIMTEESVKEELLQKHTLSFVPVKETVSGSSKEKKTNTHKQHAGHSSVPPSKKDRKAMRYERPGHLTQ